MAQTITTRHAGRALDFWGFDDKVYRGRVVRVRRRRWLDFTYYVAGLGEVRNVLDLRTHRGRVEICAQRCPQCGGHVTHHPDGRIGVPSIQAYSGRDAEPRRVLQLAAFDSCDACEWAERA